jgi:hypothetical protein
MLGSGLTKAREQMNAMKEEESRFFMKAEKAVQSNILSSALSVYQYFTDEWAEKDYPLVFNFLKFEDYKKVAAVLNKDVSLMWRREKSLNIKEYREIKNLLNLISKTEFHDNE